MKLTYFAQLTNIQALLAHHFEYGYKALKLSERGSRRRKVPDIPEVPRGPCSIYIQVTPYYSAIERLRPSNPAVPDSAFPFPEWEADANITNQSYQRPSLGDKSRMNMQDR